MLVAGVLFCLACLFRFYLHVRAWMRRSDIFHDEELLDDAEDANEHAGEAGAPPLATIGSAWNIYRSPTRARAVLSCCRPVALCRALRALPAYVDLKQRIIHASLILLAIFYLRISTLAFKAFRCVTAEDPVTNTASDAVVTYSLYLKEDLQVKITIAQASCGRTAVTLLISLNECAVCLIFYILDPLLHFIASYHCDRCLLSTVSLHSWFPATVLHPPRSRFF
jgi:hypothetical protein